MNIPPQAEQIVDKVSDLGLASAAMSIPFWIVYLEDTAKVIAIIGGLVLLGLRIAIAIRILKKNKEID